MSEARVETPTGGNEALICTNVDCREILGENNLGSWLTDPSQISSETKICTQFFGQKHDDRIVKKRADVKQIRSYSEVKIMTSKSTSTVTNAMSETDVTGNPQPSRSKNHKSIGVRGSDNTNSDREDEACYLKGSEMK